MSKGYVPLREQYDNSVSHALEYYIADWNLSLLADALGKKEDAKLFRERAMGISITIARSSVRFVPSCPTARSIPLSIRNRGRTSSRAPVSTKETPGTTRSMSPMTSKALPN